MKIMRTPQFEQQYLSLNNFEKVKLKLAKNGVKYREVQHFGQKQIEIQRIVLKAQKLEQQKYFE